MLKRLFDVLMSAVGLVLLSPVLLGIAVAVSLDSPGPVLFRQTRVARHGACFEMLKFRSMQFKHGEGGALITVAGDKRITRIGRYLRQSKLDELPQLFNVLKGDMSVVGPRPEVPKYLAFYPATLRDTVLSVRPGITDEASIEFRNESDLLAKVADPERLYIEKILPRKVEMYATYARTHSFLGDLQILARTLLRIVRG